MQLKDIEANKRYATVWLYKPGDGRFAKVASLDRRDFQDLMSRIQCVEVLEVGVQDSIRTRPGVLVKRINASTGEDSDDDPITMACARIIAPWDELIAAYEDRVEQGAVLEDRPRPSLLMAREMCTEACRKLPLEDLPQGERLWTPVHDSDQGVRGSIYEAYHGLHGQLRIGVVDTTGRVHHFDASHVMPLRIDQGEKT